MYKLHVIFFTLLFFLAYQGYALSKTILTLDRTVLTVPTREATIVNKDWICGLGEYPNQMTEQLRHLFEFTLDHLNLDESFITSKEETTTSYGGTKATFVSYNYYLIYEAQKIYSNPFLRINNARSVYLFAKKLLSLKKDTQKLNICFAHKIEILEPNKYHRKAEWRINRDTITLVPGDEFAVSVWDTPEGEYRFEGCYKIKDLLALANVQIEMARRFVQKYDKKLKMLKEMETLKKEIKKK